MRDIYITRNCWPEKEKLKLFYVFYVLVFDFRSHRASDFRRLYAIDIFHDMCVCVSVPECACVCLRVLVRFERARVPVFTCAQAATGDQGMGHGLLPAARRAPHKSLAQRQMKKKSKKKKKKRKTKKTTTTASAAYWDS